MNDEVKPIMLKLKQKNENGSRFEIEFYSTDYELIKIKEASYFSKNGDFIGKYARLQDDSDFCKYDSNFFVERLNLETTKKIIEFYENRDLFIEYLI